MPTLTWKEEYSVGVAEIDEEHKDLISLINKAESAIYELDGKEVIAKVANDMAFYALTHFSNEEVLMVTNDYPEYEKHRSQHREFSDKAKQVEELLEEVDDHTEATDLFKYLSTWLVDHILVADKELGAFLNEQGIR